jgi:hypothetical protein
MGPRASLDVLEKCKSLAPAGNQTPDHPAHNILGSARKCGINTQEF